MKKDDIFYSYNRNNETLRHTTLDDAVCEFLESTDLRPETLTVYRFKRVTVPEAEFTHAAEWALESLIENLDEEYGSPEDGGTKITDDMREAANLFGCCIAKLYVPWTCEQDGEETVDLAEWERPT